MANELEVNFVYKELLEFFPQADPRILKAVAIENHGNIDEAFCVVIDDILPHIPQRTTGLKEGVFFQPEAELEGLQNPWAGSKLRLVQEGLTSSSTPNQLAPEIEGFSATPISKLGAEKFLDQVSKINNTEELFSVVNGLAHHLNIALDKISGITLVHEEVTAENVSGKLSRRESFSSLMANEDSVQHPNVGSTSSSVLSEVTEVYHSKGEGLMDAVDVGCESDSKSYMAISGDEQEDLSSDISDSRLQEDESATDWFDATGAANGVTSLPSQTIKIDLLESSIEEAKNNKKTLFSSMEAVMNTMREVEAREKAAEKAKEEAAKAGAETLSRFEELKTMVHKAKETNDMHAGEVYGERSILATEAKELQSRLANLTEDRDEALAILDEMRYSLEARLIAADEEIKRAEEEQQDREKLAKVLLDEQESIMSKIVEESKLLMQEAEENSKLREFLVDRGQIVDILHGEIGVICQDVKSLKAKFDQRVPLSESFSTGDTTCILASSSCSSKRSLSSLVASQQEVPSETSNPPKSPREIDGDGWEISSKRSLSSLVASQQKVPSSTSSPPKSPREIDGDGWEILA